MFFSCLSSGYFLVIVTLLLTYLLIFNMLNNILDIYIGVQNQSKRMSTFLPLQTNPLQMPLLNMHTNTHYNYYGMSCNALLKQKKQKRKKKASHNGCAPSVHFGHVLYRAHMCSFTSLLHSRPNQIFCLQYSFSKSRCASTPLRTLPTTLHIFIQLLIWQLVNIATVTMVLLMLRLSQKI